MKEIILLKIGELVLKGLNRYKFEEKLIQTIKRRINKFGKFDIKKAQSTFNIEPRTDDIDIDEVVIALTRVFGIAAIEKACVCSKDMEEICDFAVVYNKQCLDKARSFKVDAKRSDKNFQYNSPQICSILGGFILDKFPHIKVDVHNPEVVITVEIRDYAAYVHSLKIPGAGGMPIGTNGKALLMLSGGIDSPVAGYMTARRGVEIDAIHFYSYPYTSERAKQKVVDLTKILCNYCGRMKLYVVPFTEIQTHIKKYCPEDLTTIVMRRIMMEIACKQAEKINAQAIVTGESIGQVASQTIYALAATDIVATMPVFRPVIAMDKNEIIQISRKIDTYETSILPYEDCCTVFTPKHPKTKLTIEEAKAAQEKFDFSLLINEALENIETIEVKNS